MKDHAMFVGKVAIGVIVGLVVYNFVNKQMAKKSLTATVSAPISTEAPTV
jgi:hypothetical protein